MNTHRDITTSIHTRIKAKLAQILTLLAPKGTTFLLCLANAQHNRPHTQLAIIIEPKIAHPLPTDRLINMIIRLLGKDKVEIEIIWGKK